MKKLIGDKAFYKRALVVLVPIIIQNGISNCVNLLDNVMVGRIGTEQMSGVAIVNQLIFVFNISIFGAISGAGIFGAQFWGSGKHEGVRHTFRFKLITAAILFTAATLIFYFFGENLIMLYLQGEGSAEEIAATMGYAKTYLSIIMFTMLPFSIVQVYTSTLRECRETVLPMKAGITAVLLDTVLNYIFIFGHFGAPALGVVGAAGSTVVARYVELAIVVIWAHRHKEKHPYIKGVYRSLHIPGRLAGKIILKGFPLLLNEILWASGMATLVQCYSIRSLTTVAGLNISTNISNVFNVVFISMGSAVGIMIGQLLGAGKIEEAKDTDRKLIALSVVSCIGIGSIMALLSSLFPMVYNTTEEVRALATWFIRISALMMPLHAFVHSTYFTLRSGGNTVVTFFFDSVFVWTVSIPMAYVLSRYTAIPIVPLYLICQSLEFIKCVVGFILLKRGKWANNIVKNE